MSSLTFGVELEFLVRFRKCSNDDYSDDSYDSGDSDDSDDSSITSCEYPILHRLHSALRSKGLVVDPKIPNQDNPDYSKWVISIDPTVTIEAPDTVKGEGFPEDPYHGGQWAFAPVEIKTPVFERWKTGWEADIRKALNAINSTFPGDIIVNDSAGLHVHVGRGKDSFSLITLQKLGAVLLSLERELDRIHPPHRVNSPFATPLRMYFRNGATEEVLKRIFSEQSPEGLVNLLNPGPCCAYNFWGMVTDRPTIEFRQHAGTVDKEEVLNWVKVVTRLVEWVEDMNEKETWQVALGGGALWELLYAIDEGHDFYGDGFWKHEYEEIEKEWDAEALIQEDV